MKRVVVLGFGPGGGGLITLDAMQALEEADLVLGAERLLDRLPSCCAAVRIKAIYSQDILAELKNHSHWRTACVVLSGDIGLFSGAKKLLDGLEGYETTAIPGISTAQYFAAGLRRPWQSWRMVSAHGIACDVAAEVSKGGETFFVTGGQHTVGTLCATLRESGLGDATVTVGQRLSCPGERILTGKAEDFADRPFDPLSVMLVEYAPPAPAWPWANTGIPDDRFLRGNAPMTKQEVRAAALAKLRIAPEDVVYDIGAGTGSVAVEMALLAGRGSVFAVERNPEALRLIRENGKAFSLHNLHTVEGEAPDALEHLPAPEAVFVGGSGGSLSGILEAVYRLNPSCRICVACVTLETLLDATRLLSTERYGDFEVCQIWVSRTRTVGGYRMMQGRNPVFLASATGVRL